LLQARHNKSVGATREIPPPRAPEEDRTESLVKSAASGHNEEHPTGTQWFGMSEMSSDPKPAAPQAKGRASRRVPPSVPERAVRPAATRAPQRAEQSDDGDDSQLRALIEAAGIEGLDPSSEAAEVLGAMLRAAVGGLMEVLRARERMKDELRVRGTTFKAANNNPLKFSANADDAFHNLLVKRNTAYLDPQTAFEDAFRDVRDHQAAFLSAMRLAFESMLSQLDPNRLQEEFDRAIKKGSILGVPAKLRYWDLYRDKYSDLAKDADGAFRSLFGDAFAKAYEEQLERLQGLARNRDK
jgi:type VI secretion system FHA domain protein